MGKSVERRDGLEKGAMTFSLPFQVNGGDVEDDPFEPQDHEESLGEGTVADALTIATSLYDRRTHKSGLYYDRFSNARFP